MLERNSAVVVREEEAGHYLVFNSENCLPLVLNRASYFIWQLCDGHREEGEIEAAVIEQYDREATGLSEEELRATVRRHFLVLEKAGLLIRQSESLAEG